MPVLYAPTIFVSSTCYDLSQVRENLREFIESLGYDPFLSEHNTFPIDPNLDTVSNCIRNVKDRADIFVLIIGNRFGFQTDQGKSITNLEYIEAKKKGIPVYIFIKKEIHHIFPVWKQNPRGDYSQIVDSSKLFEFIDFLLTSDNWVYTYDSSTDICDRLKKQLACLFMDALEIRRKLKEPTVNEEWLSLSPKALNILLYKKEGWRYLLFEEIVKEHLSSYKHLKLDIEYGIILSNHCVTEDVFELARLTIDHSKVLLSILQSVEKLIEDITPVTFKESTEDNSEAVIYLAEKFGEAYGVLVQMLYEIKSVHAPEYLNQLKRMFSEISSGLIKDMESFFNKFSETLDKELSEGFPEDKKHTVTLNLSLPDMKTFYKEVEKASKEYALQLCALEMEQEEEKT